MGRETGGDGMATVPARLASYWLGRRQYTRIDILRVGAKIPAMPVKTRQLQIRVSPEQKAALKRQAHAAGIDVSTYVLARVLPPPSDRFAAILRDVRNDANHRFALAELNDFLHACPPGAFGDAVNHAALHALSPYLQNYVAAMVEQAAAQKDVPPPAWVRDIVPLEEIGRAHV
jgi:hypothetical protein